MGTTTFSWPIVSCPNTTNNNFLRKSNSQTSIFSIQYYCLHLAVSSLYFGVKRNEESHLATDQNHRSQQFAGQRKAESLSNWQKHAFSWIGWLLFSVCRLVQSIFIPRKVFVPSRNKVRQNFALAASVAIAKKPEST